MRPRPIPSCGPTKHEISPTIHASSVSETYPEDGLGVLLGTLGTTDAAASGFGVVNVNSPLGLGLGTVVVVEGAALVVVVVVGVDGPAGNEFNQPAKSFAIL
jgi:hypothetical protein